ncbi:roadblock/LC7 domain-containing protein [Streptomyces kronopolitis]|uniref:roadblock/LC7 domain-containing protein n=1 Tax=Streptomyces kronopolitis TaxID=1612435 RepID=UPI003D9641F8
MSTDLSWLLDQLCHDTPGVRHALLLSSDGMKVAYDKSLDLDSADLLSAICSGLLSLSNKLDKAFNAGYPALTISIDTPRAQLLVVGAGTGGVLAAVAESEADPGIVGTAMSQLVERVADHLSVPTRAPRTQP